MDRANVDTDQIIPKQFLKRIERTGFGQYLFFDWRFHGRRLAESRFRAEPSQAQRGQHPVGPAEFGCGLEPRACSLGPGRLRFRAVIAPSYADIFYNNCFKNGMLPIMLPEADVDELFRRAAAREYHLTIDLESQTMTDSAGLKL